MGHSLGSLIVGGNWPEVASFANSRYGTNVSGNELKAASTGRYPQLADWWSDSTWLMWIKNRLSEITVFPHNPSTSPEIHFACELNVGFTQIEETSEMIERLRNEAVGDEPRAARSRLNPSTTSFVSPIDKLAAVVAPQN